MFREEQRFRQGWLWVLLVVTAALTIGLFGYGMYQQLLLDKPWGDNPMSDGALMVMGTVMIILMVGILWLFVTLKMVTEVRDDGVHLRYAPLARTRVTFEDIVSCQARPYSPIREFGGWGIKYGSGGKAYNVSGNHGVQLELKDGGRLLIGSQRSEALADAIRAYIVTQR